MGNIKEVKARQIFDSRGNPTVEVDVITENSVLGRAAVPSGASTGEHEAVELRDGGTDYHGKGVLKAVSNINNIIARELIGKSVFDQKLNDKLMISLDGTENKSNLGANAILGVSLAMAKAAANEKNLSLFKYLGSDSNMLPVPMMNIINGGSHSDAPIAFQEFMIMPVSADSFSHAMKMGSEIFHSLKKVLKSRGLSTSVGDEGGFAPNFKSNFEPLEFLIKAIKRAKLRPERDVMISLDVASSEFYKKNKYYLGSPKKYFSSEEMVSFLADIVKKYPIFSIEDGCAEDDWIGWKKLNSLIGDKTLTVGDDLFVTNRDRLEKGIKKNVANTILVKPNQIGTLTETLDTINLAKENKIETIISHRSGETEDNFIADLAVGSNSKMIKTGSVTRSERCSKYNRLLVIEANNRDLVFAGSLLNV